MERMERYRIAKRVYVVECAGSPSVGRPRKRWIDTVKECLKKRCLDIRQARMVQDRSEGECMGDGSLTLTRYHSYMKPLKSVCGPAYNLKSIKGTFSVFVLFLKLCFSFTVVHFMA